MDNENKSTDEIILVPITRFIAFPDHPFKVRMDESMNELAESIKLHGVLSPVIARPQEDDILEMIAGHRRLKACELADVPELPTIIKNLDDDEAIILLVDSNLHREDILPSEKA